MDTKLHKLLGCSWLHCLRSIRTTQEKRANAAMRADSRELFEQYGTAARGAMPRGKRRGHQLPDAWDDIPLGVWYNSAFQRMWLARRY